MTILMVNFKSEITMETMPITKFKAYAIKVVDQVAKSNESLIITKRGKPLAELKPYRESKKRPW